MLVTGLLSNDDAPEFVRGGQMIAVGTGVIVGLIILLVILAIAFFFVLGRARRQ